MRALVIADDGSTLASITHALTRIEEIEIARHASGRAQVEEIARALLPDVVLIHEMCWPGLALARLAEVRRGAPGATAIVVSAHLDADWLNDALKGGAAAVLPVPGDTSAFRPMLRALVSRRVDRDAEKAPTSLTA